MYGEGNFSFNFHEKPEVNHSRAPEFHLSEKDYLFHCDLPLTDAGEDSSRSSYQVRLCPQSTELEWTRKSSMSRNAHRAKVHQLNVHILLPLNQENKQEIGEETTEGTPTLTYHWVPSQKTPAPERWQTIPFTFADKIHEQFSEKYDRVLGVYEGGFKLWDCSVDLSAFFLDQCLRNAGDARDIRQFLVSYIHSGSVRLLDIGCGQGLVSLAASYGLRCLLEQNAQHACDVHFLLQDYDSDVLRKATVPNFELSTGAEGKVVPFPMRHFSFIAASWKLFIEMLKKHMGAGCSDDCLKMFAPSHILMGSDILFSPESCAEIAWLTVINAISFYHTQLTDTVDRCNDVLSPIALIGTKKHYFGTNGSVQLFFQLIREYAQSIHSLVFPHKSKIRITELIPMTETYWSNAAKDRAIIGVTFRIGKCEQT